MLSAAASLEELERCRILVGAGRRRFSSSSASTSSSAKIISWSTLPPPRMLLRGWSQVAQC
jgi:hypothetical protein